MSYLTRIVTTEDEFRELRDAWDSVVNVATDANTFLTHSWLHSWWVSYRPSANLCIVVCERAGDLVGIAPMMLTREAGLAGVFRRLRFIGDGTSETDHMNLIVREDQRKEVVASLCWAIDRLPWDIAHLNQMPEWSPNATQVLQFASTRRWLLSILRVPCPRRSLPSSFDELMASLPSRLRTAVRSARRELGSRYKLDFGLVTKREELDEALEVLYRNHAGRWQVKGESGVFVDPRKRVFYANLSERLLDDGTLRFYYLKLDGKIVAQQYCFEHAQTVMLLQEGFDYNFAKQNVGNVLRAMVFEHLIAAGVKVYDFLEGTSRHKQNWSDSAPCDLSIRACRPTFVGRVAYQVPRLVARFRGTAMPETSSVG